MVNSSTRSNVLVFVEPFEGFTKKVLEKELMQISDNSTVVIFTTVPHHIASLSYYHSVTGVVIDFNSNCINFWAVINEKIVSQHPFDQIYHGVDSPYNQNLFHLLFAPKNEIMALNYAQVQNFWKEKIESLHLSNLPLLVASKFKSLLEPLTTEQQKQVSSCVVVTGSFVREALIDEIEKNISLLIKPKLFTVNFPKNKDLSPLVNPSDCHVLGALNWYERTKLSYIKNNDLSGFFAKHHCTEGGSPLDVENILKNN